MLGHGRHVAGAHGDVRGDRRQLQVHVAGAHGHGDELGDRRQLQVHVATSPAASRPRSPTAPGGVGAGPSTTRSQRPNPLHCDRTESQKRSSERFETFRLKGQRFDLAVFARWLRQRTFVILDFRIFDDRSANGRSPAQKFLRKEKLLSAPSLSGGLSVGGLAQRLAEKNGEMGDTDSGS